MYFLGDYLADTEFCNAVVDDMASRLPESTPDYASIQSVWSKTTAKSSLRRLFLSMWSTKAPNVVFSYLKDHEGDLKGFVFDYLDCILDSDVLNSPTCDPALVKYYVATLKRGLERGHSEVCTSANHLVEDDGDESA